MERGGFGPPLFYLEQHVRETPEAVKEDDGNDFSGDGIAEATDAAKATGFGDVVRVRQRAGHLRRKGRQLDEGAKVRINLSSRGRWTTRRVLEGFNEHAKIPLLERLSTDASST